MNQPFEKIIEAVQKGDMDAFERLYNASAQKFRAYLYPMLKNDQDIEDVLQEAYVYIYQNLDKLEGPDVFLAWGKSICRNIALHHLRTAKRHWGQDEFRPMFSDEDQEGMDAIPVTDERGDYADPQVQMDAQETKRLLDEMIGSLPENQRICIVLWQEGLSMSEIAEQLGMPKGTVNSNINYAKKKIKDQVLLLEKKGTKLYNLAPIPFFLWIMSQFRDHGASAMPAGSGAALLSALEESGKAAQAGQNVSSAAGEAAAEAAEAAAGEAAAGTAGTAAAGTAGTSAAGAAGTAAAGAAGTAAKVGLGKMIAIALAGCAVIGGGAAYVASRQEPEPAVQEEVREDTFAEGSLLQAVLQNISQEDAEESADENINESADETAGGSIDEELLGRIGGGLTQDELLAMLMYVPSDYSGSMDEDNMWTFVNALLSENSMELDFGRSYSAADSASQWNTEILNKILAVMGATPMTDENASYWENIGFHVEGSKVSYSAASTSRGNVIKILSTEQGDNEIRIAYEVTTSYADEREDSTEGRTAYFTPNGDGNYILSRVTLEETPEEPAQTGQSAAGDWQTAYTEVLSDPVGWLRDTQGVETTATLGLPLADLSPYEYTLFDMDQDGTPELIITVFDSSTVNNNWFFCTYDPDRGAQLLSNQEWSAGMQMVVCEGQLAWNSYGRWDSNMSHAISSISLTEEDPEVIYRFVGLPEEETDAPEAENVEFYPVEDTSYISSYPGIE
ncbi:MAG TPA: sigma-70 family RNA polymerase sigma factor [Candidatus Choladocola avistercoris]|nr:sigma-70 family RNA polymerase sigma factor [Candidatus Choladocola avistercoris]